MRALDLFCGAGGATKGLQQAGFSVWGVDITGQPHYCGNRFMQANVLSMDLDFIREFSFIWASPPCQRYCALKTMPNARQHPDLVGPVREMLIASDRPYIIENVFGAPLHNPVMLCGSFFGLRSGEYQLRRHRYFESNVVFSITFRCKHSGKTLGVYGDKVRDIAREKRHYAKDKVTRGLPVGVVLPQQYGHEAMEIDWMSRKELSEAVPPAYSRYLAKQVVDMLNG